MDGTHTLQNLNDESTYERMRMGFYQRIEKGAEVID
jgi:hypothetical protein